MGTPHSQASPGTTDSRGIVRRLDPFGDSCCAATGSLVADPRARIGHDGKPRIFNCSVCGRQWRRGDGVRDMFTLTEKGARVASMLAKEDAR